MLVLSNKSHFGVSFTELSLQTPTSEVEADFNAGDLISSLSKNPLNWVVFLFIQLATLAQRLIYDGIPFPTMIEQNSLEKSLQFLVVRITFIPHFDIRL